MTKPQLLIDTDPGVDDALAILMAHAHADVVGLSIAAGNVGLAHTVRNARVLVDLLEADTPVFPGCASPLVRAPDEDAAFVHGQDGFGDIGFPSPHAALAEEPAALALLRLTRERPGELTLVALAPLTNLALALRLDPSLPERVARLVIMGGAVTGHGNTGRVPAEFNIGFDPEAAHVVFEAFPTLFMAPIPSKAANAWQTTPLPIIESTANFLTAALTEGSPAGVTWWANFVRQAAQAFVDFHPDTRYDERIYQITWEPRFKGTFEQITRIYQIAYPLIHAIDPKAIVAGPSASAMNDAQRTTRWRSRSRLPGS
ncbi:MAG: hypothetical protein WDW38_000202 [Sanguina aurantia]